MAFPEKKRRMLKLITSNLSADQDSLYFAYAVPFDLIATQRNDIDGGPSKVVHRTLDALLMQLLTHFEMEPPVGLTAAAD